jgi:RNA-binding protein YhbY
MHSGQLDHRPTPSESMQNPWAKPPHPTHLDLTATDRAALKKIGAQLTPIVRIGFKEKLSTHVVAKSNAELTRHQIIKVEFVKLKSAEVATCSAELAEQTASLLVEIHGDFAIFLRKHPNKTLDDIYSTFLA